ncbi:MAG: TlpA disulfide reductase family protein [Bacteroidota bacterium]
MKNLLLLSAIVLLYACQKQSIPPNTYELKAVLSGIPDGSIAKIHFNDDHIDSAVVKQEQVVITGAINAPESVFFEINGFEDYKGFWLEPAAVSLKAEKGKFRKAVISGSKTQDEDNLLKQLLLPLKEEMDSLYKAAMSWTEEEKQNKDFKKAFMDQEAHLYSQIGIVTQDWIRQNPQSLVSLKNLAIYKTTWGKAISEELFQMMSKEQQLSEKGKKIARFLALSNPPGIGEAYVDFTQNNVDGIPVKLSEVGGKVILLEFWASWCGPCRASNPKLVALYKDYKEKGFEILGISLDEKKDAWVGAIEKDGLPWEQVSDLNGDENEAALIYDVGAIPYNVLIGEDGTVLATGFGVDELRAKLKQLFTPEKI